MKKLIQLSILAMALILTGSFFVAAQDNVSMNKNDKMDSKMLNDTDKDFANMAAMGGAAEIQWAELALQKSTNKSVKNYASTMIKTHTKAGKDLEKAALKNNITLPTTMSDEQMQILNQLQQATGDEFDKLYIQKAGLEAHHKMEELFVGESSAGNNKNLVNFARDNMSTVQTHLQMAEDLAKKLNK